MGEQRVSSVLFFVLFSVLTLLWLATQSIVNSTYREADTLFSVVPSDIPGHYRLYVFAQQSRLTDEHPDAFYLSPGKQAKEAFDVDHEVFGVTYGVVPLDGSSQDPITKVGAGGVKDGVKIASSLIDGFEVHDSDGRVVIADWPKTF